MSGVRLPHDFELDLKTYRQDYAGSRQVGTGADFLAIPPEGLYDSDEQAMFEAMLAAAPVLGGLAAGKEVSSDVRFLSVRTLQQGGGRLLGEDKGWLIWGRHGDYAAWHDSRGHGPQEPNLAYGLALKPTGQLEEFDVPPDPSIFESGGYVPRTHIISVRNGLLTGDHWPLGAADNRRVTGVTIPKMYHGLISFADAVVPAD